MFLVRLPGLYREQPPPCRVKYITDTTGGLRYPLNVSSPIRPFIELLLDPGTISWSELYSRDSTRQEVYCFC